MDPRAKGEALWLLLSEMMRTEGLRRDAFTNSGCCVDGAICCPPFFKRAWYNSGRAYLGTFEIENAGMPFTSCSGATFLFKNALRGEVWESA